jgi:hypothetical protein
LRDVCRAWDVWYYHLPFAARLVGLVRPDEYALHATNQSRFDGFPLLAELLQGIAWRLTGRPEGANLVSLGSLALYLAFLGRAFRVPAHLGFIALMAVPLVQIHATAAYVDLPSNACAAALVLCVVRLYATPLELQAKDLFYGVLALASVVANMRFQLHPVVAVAVLAALPRMLPTLIRGRDVKGLAAALLSVPLVGATFLRNFIVHHNPYFPMRIALGGVMLPGLDEPYRSSPIALQGFPRSARFVYSVLEIGLPPLGDGRRWTIDQWAPWDSPALRMGGFFGAYVVFHLALFAWAVATERSRRARVAAVAFVALTVLVAHLPQSHELRYYLVWMIVLVSLNLWLACGEAPSAREVGIGFACAGFLAMVIVVTRATYVSSSGMTFAEHLRDKVDPALLAQIQEGDRVCLKREPNTFLYAAHFHARRYLVKEAESPDECGDARWIP